MNTSATAAQFPLEPGEAEREAKSVLVVGAGMMADDLQHVTLVGFSMGEGGPRLAHAHDAISR